MYTSKIIGVETVFYQASNSHFVDVEVEIYKETEPGQDDVLVAVRKFGYPVGTTGDEILLELEKVCASFEADADTTAKSAELEAVLSQAESLKEELMPTKAEKISEKI